VQAVLNGPVAADDGGELGGAGWVAVSEMMA
jgi:hypothetical protein